MSSKKNKIQPIHKTTVAEAAAALQAEAIKPMELLHLRAAHDRARGPLEAIQAIESMLVSSYQINVQAGDRIDLQTGRIQRAPKPAAA